MKRILLLSIAALFGIILSAQAQTQQGYVKTKGRMVDGKLVPGQGLKGANIFVHGRNAILVDTDDGAFNLFITETQFRLDSVSKKGYQLVDMDAIGKTYSLSANPIYLVMETPEQQIQDQLTAERRIRRTLTNQLHQREDEIEALKEQQKISEEEYREALQKLYEDVDQNEQLVKDMVERYSKIDYDQLDEFYRQVSYYIENGELVRADSLLRTRGNLPAQVGDILQRGQALQEEREQLQMAEAVQQSDIEEAARRCYSYFETFKMLHENDSAAYYIELRTRLDTTNIYWQNDAGEFLDKIADYSDAMIYFQNAIRLCIQKYGEFSEEAAAIYHNIGLEYQQIGNYEEAFSYITKAIEINQTIFGVNSVEIAHNYEALGILNRKTNNYDKAIEYYEKALAIYNNISTEKHYSKIAGIFNNQGVVYDAWGNYLKALELYQKSVQIHSQFLAEDNPNFVDVYYNIGSAYKNLGDYDKALEYIGKALSISVAVYGENHPDVAYCYNELGILYANQGDYPKAFEYFEKALSIFKFTFGENHSSIAVCYCNIGVILSNLEQEAKALEYLLKALEISRTIYGEIHNYTASCYHNIGASYLGIEDYAMAQEYLLKALTVMKTILGENHPNIAVVYNNLSVICNHQSKYDQSIEYLEKAIAIDLAFFGENHIHISYDYFNIAYAYEKKGDLQKALEYYQKALSIREPILGPDHPKTQNTRQAVEEIQSKLKEQEAPTNE